MMMIKHTIQIILIIAGFILCIFLPYMPGEYDSASLTLSFSVQLLSFASLILIPVGIIWLVYEFRKNRRESVTPSNGSYYFAVAACLIITVVGLFLCISLFVSGNRAIGLIIGIILFISFIRTMLRIRKLKATTSRKFYVMPVYMICIPLVVFIVRYSFIDRAVGYSRNRAINASKELIKDIEAYYSTHGSYPVSMNAVHHDYKTSVTGIKRYHYERNGNAYNLYFEAVPGDLATIQIVMYNKLDQHQMTSHDQDLLLLSPSALNQQRGYFSIQNLPQPHWKYFLFD